MVPLLWLSVWSSLSLQFPADKHNTIPAERPTPHQHKQNNQYDTFLKTWKNVVDRESSQRMHAGIKRNVALAWHVKRYISFIFFYWSYAGHIKVYLYPRDIMWFLSYFPFSLFLSGQRCNTNWYWVGTLMHKYEMAICICPLFTAVLFYVSLKCFLLVLWDSVSTTDLSRKSWYMMGEKEQFPAVYQSRKVSVKKGLLRYLDTPLYVE